MKRKQNMHEPSFYRGLIREQKSKKGRHPKILLDKTRDIKDPYYVSLALFRLSDDPRLPISEAKLIAREAIQLAEKEQRLWRRAELYGKLAKYAKIWNKKYSPHESDYFLDEILKKLQEFPTGKGLSQNINEISKHIGCKRLPILLNIAITNTEFILEDCRSVLRRWSMCCQHHVSPTEIYRILLNISDLFHQSKLLGYFYLQCVKNNIDFFEALKSAVDSALKIETKEKIDAFRYLSRISSSQQDFIYLNKVITSLSNAIQQVRLLTTLAGYADKKNYKSLCFNFFNEAIEKSINIKNPHNQIKEQLKIAIGLSKINKKEKARKILVETHQSTTDEKLKKQIEKTMQKHNISLNEIQPVTTAQKPSQSPMSNLLPSMGCSLGLYNTYKGGIKPVHIRMIARAAPLCAAFGFDLALLGFPIKQLSSFINQATTDTTIGKNGKYLQFLFNEQRIHIYPCSQKTIPRFSKHEIVIATTAHPDKNKSISFQESIKKHRKNSKNNLIIVMGLGKKGLPAAFLKQVKYHLELTGKNVGLETCTSMGIIAIKLHEQLHKD